MRRQSLAKQTCLRSENVGISHSSMFWRSAQLMNAVTMSALDADTGTTCSHNGPITALQSTHVVMAGKKT